MFYQCLSAIVFGVILLLNILASNLTAPACADPITIRIVSKDLLTSNPDDIKLVEFYEKALKERGVDLRIKIIDLPSAGYADKLSAMIFAGDIPDLLYFQGGDAKMAEQGILEDWHNWLPQTTYLKQALFPHNLERLKNYPYLLHIFPPRAAQPVIRQDWLAKSGLPLPQSVEEYVALFMAIKNGDFDGNGKADSYGVTTAQNTGELDAIFNQAFGITGAWMKNTIGEWDHSRISNAEKDKIEFYASLIAQKLYDPEFMTTKWDIREDKFYSGRVGVIFGSSAETLDIIGGKMRQAHPGQNISLTLLPPPAGPAGKGLAAIDLSKESRGFAINATSQHKAEVVKLLDFLASPEGQQIERFGFEGVHYHKLGDSIQFTDKSATWYPRFLAAANFQPAAERMSEAAQQSLATIAASFQPDNAFIWPAEYATLLDATEGVYRSWVYKFITNAAPLSQWDHYVAEWNAAGGAQLTAYARTILK